ncbi:hypothetical protein [Pseudomonas sp. P8_250]|uniref:hypothetical protein n=1 Tax=Pseudomonas sp. P8_250 TaxID=3043446 RepID=UPI002A36A214|nr:hypothetical protein [Pseudomonas sp. P8_250]MDX9668704.1 hypothetical protein [Pseudomonas sp. P8_250]
MAIVISFDEEMKDPRTLFILEDAVAVGVHAEHFCRSQGLEYNPKRMQAKMKVGLRSFRWFWDWPRDVGSVRQGERGSWAWNYAGIELNRLELHTSIASSDLNYLFTRMRGIPLSLANKEQRNVQDETSRVE